MKKIVLWSGLCVVALAVAALVYWETRPQVVILKNGTRITLVSVTYGKHHVFKGVKTTGSRPRGRATLDTTNDTVVVWIKSEHKMSQYPNYQLLVYDSANTACVGAWQRTGNQIKNGVEIMGFALDAFPRRDRKMILRVADWGNGSGMHIAKGEFVVSNPGPRSFPDWQPDPLPDTQSDGDLDVTLTKCAWVAQGFMFGNVTAPPGDSMRKAVAVTFHFEQNGNIATNWQPVAIVTSDATGNHSSLNGWSSSHDDKGDPTMTYQWGLWPEEKAWKLRVEMSRSSGFNNNEEWAVSNIPLKKGNWNDLWNYNMGRNHPTDSPVAETTLQGVHLKIFPAIETDQNFGMGQKSGGVHVTVKPDLPEGFRMSLVDLTDENGHKLPPTWGPNGSGNGNYIFQLPDIRNAKSLNLTIVVHQSRFVEFTVKPTPQ
jgi:hypothetical protein